MRLIDADNNCENICRCNNEMCDKSKCPVCCAQTAYDPDNVVEQLEDNRMWKELLIYDLSYREREIVKKAIDIVKGGMK